MRHLVVVVVVLAVVPLLGATALGQPATFSWEGSLEGWLPDPGGNGTTATPRHRDYLSGLSPDLSDAVTDGDYALELTNSSFGPFIKMLRGGHAEVAILTNTTLEFDVYIPSAIIPDDPPPTWLEVQLQWQGGGPNIGFRNYDHTTEISRTDIDPVGELYAVSWEYAAEDGFDDDAWWWGQLDIAIAGDANPEVSYSPIYIDNFRFTNSNATPGDFDGDGDVDGDDFLIWQSGFNVDASGDADGDGDTDGDDFLIWQSGFGAGDGAGAAAVPEPTSIAILAVACAFCCCRGRVGRQRVR